MNMITANIIQQNKLDYFPSDLSFIVQAALESPAQSTYIATRTDKGPPKRRPLTSPHLHTIAINLNAAQYDNLQSFFEANSVFAYRTPTGQQDIILRFASAPTIQKHLDVGGPTEVIECQIIFAKV